MVTALSTNNYHVEEVGEFVFKPMCDRAAKGHSLSYEKKHAFVCIERKVNAD
tara:strand:+ start:203 stop:358 length:156 start_codon:yes stop_codon:yes gene_type:complete